MLLRSKRIMEKAKSTEVLNNSMTSPAESDNEKTIIGKDESSIDDLREEIMLLRNSLKQLLDTARSSAAAITPTDSQQPAKTHGITQQVTMPPDVATTVFLSTPDLTTVPAQQQEINTREYSMPLHFYKPNSAAQPFSPITMTPLPYSATQTFIPRTTPMSYPAAQTFAHVTTPMPYSAAQSFVQETTPMPYSATRSFVPTTTLSTPLNFLQQQSTQMYTTAQPRMTPTTSTQLPVSSFSASLNAPGYQSANDCRQLRKLHDLPQFSGQPEQWPMFIVTYNETTMNYSYTNLENLIRLQKSLRGNARAKVEAFLIHPDSVNQVISTLEFYYGRPQVLIRSQIAKVRAFPPISERKIYEIVNFSTLVLNLSAFLINANATPHLCNPTLLDELVNKLPLQKREEWTKHSMKHLGSYPSVSDFSLWLQEVATYVSFSMEADESKIDVGNKKERMNPSFTIIKEDKKLTKCLMCRQNHHLYQCEEFRKIPTSNRWNFIKENRLCFSCLRAGHSSIKCKNKRKCGLLKCMKYHNRLLHEDSKTNACQANNTDGKTTSEIYKDTASGEIEYNGGEYNNSGLVNTIVENSLENETLYKYLPVEVTGPNGTVKVVAFIDEGSKITLLENEIADKIGLKGVSSNLCLGWIGGKTTNEVSRKVNLEISAIGTNKTSFQMKNVWTTMNLELPAQNLQFREFKKIYPILNELFVEDYCNARPKLLIGLPHIRLVRPLKVLNLDKCFSVHQTDLGNVLFGSSEDSTGTTVCKIDVNIVDNLHREVLDYFTLENLGVKLLEPVVSRDDERAEKILRTTTVKAGLHFETGLLWKHDNFEAKNSYSMALKRLYGMEAKIKNNKDLAEWYAAKINEYISKSYARKLTPEEVATKNSRTWYLPHFVVTNANKENKRRIVFDAAASVDGESFNSRLMKGPTKYQPKSLLSILFRFRQRKIGVCADIKEMFHRVRIREEDQTAQRFLWRNGHTNAPPDEYVMQVMIFGSASSPCSAQYVKNLNAQTYEDSHPRAYQAIVDRHYVDDYVDSFDEVAEAINVTRDVVNIHRQAGFELRGFVSNSSEFLTAMSNRNAMDDDLFLSNLCNGEANSEKILGMRWRLSDDSFCFLFKFTRVPEAVLNGNRKPTKSEMLSLTMSIFDPFGFLANVTIKSKILLQELWRSKVSWDQPIPDEIYRKWNVWYKSLYDIQYARIPRNYCEHLFSTKTKVELHIFVDASEVAFAAVAYWRLYYNGKVNIVFITGKSRCAPLKPLSIPRLELQAAVLGVRLKESIISCHDIKPSEITFWSDSKTVIKWIQSDCRTYKQFVAHRIAEILESSEEKQWCWLPGSINPADDATRPQDFSDMYLTSRWLNGPAFLEGEKENWPKLPNDIGDHECQSEKRPKFIFTINKESFIPFNRYSSFYKLLRIMCWVRRAGAFFKAYGINRKILAKTYGPQLSVKEIDGTAEYLCRIVQRDVFYKEYNQLRENNAVHKSSQIFKLTPFLCTDGLIRLSGRINNATCVTRSTKEPIILPKKHILTRLIVKRYHEDFQHQNQEAICAAIRTRFWVPSLRQLVRSAKKDCQICKNMFAIPRPPLMGQHPEDRLKPFVRPFSYTGVDYIGPFFVSVGRRHEKRWVALFTCLTVRAIHVEVARDLSTNAVIMCIRNFVNRRGVPVRIRSDRGTNFIGASKEEFVADESRLVNECAQRGIEWLFNTPANPSAGGAWERMVRSLKNVLAFTLREKAPQVETFNSLLIEAENLINSRPLTHLPIEGIEAEPLTPNHFLIGCPNILRTPGVPEMVCLKKQWQVLQQLKQTFWKRWILEYLPELTRRTKWYQPVKPIQIGDIVIICEDSETRGQWKRGIVEEVFPAADGQVRSAVVKTALGRLRRPASKLAILDVCGKSP